MENCRSILRAGSSAILALSGLFVFSAPVSASPARITHFELAANLSVRSATQNAGKSKLLSAPSKVVAFEAFGNRFAVDLQPNYRLVAPLIARGELAYEDVSIFTGALPNVPDSWARFGIDGKRISGVLWDGSTMYLIETAANVRSLLAAPVDDRTVVVFKASDVHFPIDRVVQDGKVVEKIRGDELIAHTVSLAGQPIPSRRMSLGLLGDSSYAESELAMVFAMTNANHADGIFTSQMNMHFRLEQLDMLEGATDPFVGTDGEELLAQLMDYKESSPQYAPLGLTHLLTRRFLDDNLGGIALLESTCGPRAGVGLTSANHGIAWIIMAHEIAHNLGAPHDGEPGACAATPKTFLMSPEYNDSDRFSSCSLQEMERYLASASCLTPVGAGELEVAVEPLPEVVYYDEPIRFRYYVNSIGNDSVFEAETRIDAGTDFEIVRFYAEEYGVLCDFIVTPDYGECAFGNLHSGFSGSLGMEVIPRTTGRAELLVQADGLNDTDPSNNLATISVQVEPATKIFSRGHTFQDIRPGETTTTTIKVENEGDFPSAGTLRIDTDPANSLSSLATFCSQPTAGSLDCAIDTMASREIRYLDLEFTPGDLQLGLNDMKTEIIWLTTTTALAGSEPPDRVIHSVAVWGSYKDVRVELVSLSGNLSKGDTAQLVAAVVNDGPDPSPATHVYITVGPGERIDAAEGSDGACTWTATNAVCETPLLAVGERLEVTVDFAVLNSGNQKVTVSTSAGGFDYDRANDTVIGTYLVARAEEPGGGSNNGGGGGAATWLAMLAALQLLAGAMCRARRAACRNQIVWSTASPP